MIELDYTSPAALQLTYARRMRIWLDNKEKKLWSNYSAMYNFRKCSDLESIVYYLPHISFTTDYEDKMAKQNSDFNLIDYRMNDDELAAFDKWAKDKPNDPTAALIDLAGQGYKISITYVDKSEAWCISLTGKEEAKFNSKSTLTTWADDPLEGIYMAHFKAAVIFKGGKWTTKTQSRRG